MISNSVQSEVYYLYEVCQRAITYSTLHSIVLQIHARTTSMATSFATLPGLP